jgi:hypothetical protein
VPFLGGIAFASLGAAAPLPENVPELLLASLALGERDDALSAFRPDPVSADGSSVGRASAAPRDRSAITTAGPPLAHDHPAPGRERRPAA